MDQHNQLNNLAINLQKLRLGSYAVDDNVDLSLERRSKNITESVRVPSSEHVAEIVGRQGCKIKSLRTKTKTYIKTPVRGEEPVFVVTGPVEDVAAAKHEILSTAEHFTKIRANRRSNANMPNNRPEDVNIEVHVMARHVGLLVGAKGSTIKNIQQKTDTYIITPSREKKPIFEVRGLPRNVKRARDLMYEHIYERTGICMDEPLIQKSMRCNLENPFALTPSSAMTLFAKNLQTDPQYEFILNNNFEPSTGYDTDEGFVGGSSLGYDTLTNSIWSPGEESNLNKILAPTSLNLPLTVANADLQSLMSGESPGQRDLSPMSYGALSDLSSGVSSLVSSPVFGSGGPASLLQQKQCLLCRRDDGLAVVCGCSMFCYECASQNLQRTSEGDIVCPACHSKVEQLVL